MTLPQRQRVLLFTFLGMMVIVFGLLTWRLVHLQFTMKQQFTESSERQRHAVIGAQPRRGLILDARGRILAASVKTYNVFAEPRYLLEDVEKLKTTAISLQQVLNEPGHELCALIDTSRNPGYVKLKEDIGFEEKKLLKEIYIPGVGVETDWKRLYPAGHLTGHLLGFVGAENKGLAGVEVKYDSVLCGQSGKEVFVVDNRRRPIGAQPGASSRVQDGQNLVLTIDAVIQRYTHEALQKQMEAYEAESAVAMVMNPWTGAILAMVSLPDYDPTQFSTTPQDKMRNRILTDPYEPGSIFKPIVAAAALEAGSIGYEEKFDCEMGYYARYRIGEFGNHQYGMLSMREILIHSSNVGMAKIGLKMGQKKLYDGLRLMGFSERTGIDLPGEDPGRLWPLSKWSGWSVTRIPFGHEVTVTPLQICRAYCLFANGGYIVKPHLVRAVIDRQGNVIQDKQPAIKTGYVLKNEVAEWMVQKALSDVVNEGTGDKAALEDCQVWGKTGTANIALPGGGYDTKNYVASFVGGAPAKTPAVVVLVSIRKPNRSLGKGYSGGRVAAPVVHDILKNTLDYLGVTGQEQPSESD
ncbi:MAG: peptidoglycan D,D-transpeptidase FtsI family protein [Planctomycetota bacterium]|jgi:cell division protein FtsI/penicillin-binding protein 2